MWLAQMFGAPKVAIGVVHLLPLPGSPLCKGSLREVFDQATASAAVLRSAGFHAVLIENFGDVPFFPDTVPPHVVAFTAVVVRELARDGPCGVNLLRNAASQALAVAFAGGGSFIRVNVHIGAAVTDQGLLQGRACETLRYRRQLGAAVKIFADVAVKHATPVFPQDPLREARDCVERGLADALIVTGPSTGAPADLSLVERIKGALPRVPVFVGSGVTPETVRDSVAVSDGIIVGTALEHAPGLLSEEKARRFMEAFRDACAERG